MSSEMPPFRLVLEPLNDEAAALLERPAHVWEQVGERFRLGGRPDVHTNSEWPNCPQCREAMCFYGQLDGLPKPSEFDLADAGLVLVYVCFGCFEVTSFIDSA